MEKAWRKNLIEITPYVSGEQPKTDNIIKLNANENPFPPSPAVVEAIRAIDNAAFKKYPDSTASGVRKALAGYYGVSPENVFVGNGSDDVLALSFRAFFNSEKPIFFPDITYSFYPVWCSLLKIPYKTIPVSEDFRIIPEDYYAENGGVVIPNPNAPTSIGEGRDFIEKILENNKDVIVIIDEAYVDFGGYSSIDLLKKYEEANRVNRNLLFLWDWMYKNRVNPAGIREKLEKYGIFTMGDIAKTSINNEELLYKLFGVNAELLIDHAWGWEPTTIKRVKEYKPQSNSLSVGQVLHCPYDYTKTKSL